MPVNDDMYEQPEKVYWNKSRFHNHQIVEDIEAAQIVREKNHRTSHIVLDVDEIIDEVNKQKYCDYELPSADGDYKGYILVGNWLVWDSYHPSYEFDTVKEWNDEIYPTLVKSGYTPKLIP